MEPLLLEQRLRVFRRAEIAANGGAPKGGWKSPIFLEKGARIEYDLLPTSNSNPVFPGYVKVRFSRAGFKHEGFVPEAALRSQVAAAAAAQAKRSSDKSRFNNFKKHMKFLVSLAYNRMR